jgi:ribosomal protein S18 acetylase RimI-like enzyme
MGELAIAHLTEADFDEAGPVLDAAFQDHGLRAGLERNYAAQPGGWLCARCDQRLVGLVGAALYGGYASIGMMAVHPDFQKQGIGFRLMDGIVKWITFEQGCPAAILDANPWAVNLYRKVGFRETGITYQMRREPHHPLPIDPDPRVRPMRESDMPAVIDIDCRVMGGDRHAVLQMLWRHYGDRAFVAESRTGSLSGYIFAQARLVGPWMADTAEIAEALLRRSLTLEFPNIPAVNIPGCNPQASVIAEGYGFHTVRALPHMVYGAEIARQNCTPYFGEVSFMFG